MDEKNQTNFFDADDILDPKAYEEEGDVKKDENPEPTPSTPDSDKPKVPEETNDNANVDLEAKKKEEEREKNARYAEQRRKKEAEEREKKIRDEAKIEVLKSNPYTNEDIKDEEDLRIYELMKSLDDEGLDPVKDLPKKIAEQNRENAKKIQEEKAKEIAKNEKLDREAKELKEAYPNLDLAKLANDSEFMKLCEEKGERWTMLEIYEFLDSKKQVANKEVADNKEKEELDKLSKKVVKTPSSKSNSKNPERTYLDMSDEEYKKLQNNNNKYDYFEVDY